MKRHRVRIGFSLVEVLIAVIILALGLLGIGAVIPVIIRAQRESSAATLGIVALQDAESHLRGRRDFVRLHHHLDPNAESGLGILVLDDTWSPTGLWVPFDDEVDLVTGDIFLEDPGADVDPTILRTRDRLWPGVGAASPRLVWDVVARRSRPNDPDPNATPPQIGITDVGFVQLAVFVRRIDPNIRIPGNVTLLRILTDPVLPDALRRVPVGVDTLGYPTFNGLDGTGKRRYGMPITLQATFDEDEREKIEFTGGADEITLASQIGQRLVDNLGNIYTVTRRDEEDGVSVFITPPVPAWVPDPDQALPAARFEQVVFTPQIPAAVGVIELAVKD